MLRVTGQQPEYDKNYGTSVLGQAQGGPIRLAEGGAVNEQNPVLRDVLRRRMAQGQFNPGENAIRIRCAQRYQLFGSHVAGEP
jgi:hypothetical protein